MTLHDLLEKTYILQRDSFGIDPTDLEGEEFAAFIRDNVLAAIVELAEFIQELPWKPWKDGNGRPDTEARERAVVEIVDVLHFIFNIAVALRVSGHELEAVYEAKRQINAQRQAAREHFEGIGTMRRSGDPDACGWEPDERVEDAYPVS